ncbi:hypothetical protein TH61_00320 [Rufibacter sp. DG15C]|uniref:hypothetical protein n=1 Tax=Rufibacter sp. DG15C TaxID=1379909 RepID=UPI00078C0A1A|nr:hypothetical protein [Rufibacter sp. DG15C]AMM49929.1 hypothetical protein TH61_00320 [Rufibacter sp. DG15C]
MKRSLLLGLFLFILITGSAQSLPDSVHVLPSPYYAKAQFAGDIGFVSVGIGRESINRKLNTDLSVGYLPESIGGDAIFTIALKSTMLPLKPARIKTLDWYYFTAGAQLSYTFGDEYFAWEGYLSKYPNSYYRFSTALSVYVFAGGQVDFTRVPKLQKFSAYYEVGAPGEYVISHLQNPKYLSLSKIFHLALGVKMALR